MATSTPERGSDRSDNRDTEKQLLGEKQLQGQYSVANCSTLQFTLLINPKSTYGLNQSE